MSAYGGANVNQYGCFTLQCTHNDIALNVEFHVTEDTGSTMLGLQACIALRLISLNCEQNSACNDCHKNSQLYAIQEEGNSKSSSEGVGATFLQHGRPVACASKSLTETESNYCNIDREMLGIVFGLERFHHYTYRRNVTSRSKQIKNLRNQSP